MSLRLKVTALVAAAAACAWVAAQDESEKRPPAGVGDAAPKFKAREMAGGAIEFPGQYRGKLVLVDFWATWCPPCRREVPTLKESYAKYREQGVEFLGINLDAAPPYRKSADVVKEFMREHGMSWPQVYDGAVDIADKYGVMFIPTPVLVDGDTGKILARGESLLGDSLDKTLAQHVAARRKGS